jgi:hypothetical protein
MRANSEGMEIMFFVVTVVVMALLVSHDLHSDKGKTFGFAN